MDQLRRMTVGFYDYIGQNDIFSYSNWKTSGLKKKKSEKKKTEKLSYFFAALPWLLEGDILINSCELIFCHKLVMLVPFCSYGDVLIVIAEGGGRNIRGKALNPSETHKFNCSHFFYRFKGGLNINITKSK